MIEDANKTCNRAKSATNRSKQAEANEDDHTGNVDVKELCRLSLQPCGLVGDEERALIVLDHDEHGCEEHRDWKEESI